MPSEVIIEMPQYEKLDISRIRAKVADIKESVRFFNFSEKIW